MSERMMWALSVERFTGFRDLEFSDVARPEPGELEALIRVSAVALSRSDLAGLTDRAISNRDPWIPGVSIAGEVVQGSRFPTGTPVLIDPYISCGNCRLCFSSSGCLSPRVIGRHRPGGLAEYVTCPTDRLVPLPRIIGPEEGAAFAAAGSIASKIIFDDLRLRPADRLLLTGSTGSLGLTVVLLARAHGADVMALVSRSDRAVLSTKAGAHAAVPIEYDGRIFEPSDLGGSVDAVVHLGRDLGWLERLMDCLHPGGRVLLRRVAAGERLYLDVGTIAAQGLRIIGSVGSGSSGLARAMSTLVASPHSVVVDDVLPMEQLSVGFERLAARCNRGTIVMRSPE